MDVAADVAVMTEAAVAVEVEAADAAECPPATTSLLTLKV